MKGRMHNKRLQLFELIKTSVKMNLMQWRSVGDLTTHAIFRLRLDDVIVLS